MVYIDYENIHNILKKYYTNALETNMFEKIIKECEINNLNIMDIFVYSNFDVKDLHESYHQTRLLQLNVEIKHTCNKSKNYADLQIAVDALEQAYNNSNVDGFVIISSDKDMIPLIKALKRKNKYVYWITTIKDCDFGVQIFPNKHESLENILKLSEDYGKTIENAQKSVDEELYEYFNKYIENAYRKSTKYQDIEFGYGCTL